MYKKAIPMLVLACLTAAQTFAQDYKDIEWQDLIPAQDREILSNPPMSLTTIPEGSGMDSIDMLRQQSFSDPELAKYLEALHSTNVVETLAGQSVALPGYIVPLEYTEELKVTKFFIVPWFGACIHTPPPPPNQTVMGIMPQGMMLDSLMTPLIFKGKLSTTLTVDPLATATYALAVDEIEVLDWRRYR